MTETVVDLVAEQAARHGERVLYSFGDVGSGPELSFVGLDREARRVATCVAERVAPGGRVILVYPPGLDFVVGFMGAVLAGAIPVPVYPPAPPRLQYGIEQLRSVAASCRPDLVLTAGSLAEHRVEVDGHPVDWLRTDDPHAGDADEWRRPRVTADAPAFLQYTSGSTAAPRGVLIRHRNVLANAAAIQQAMRVDTDTVGVSWLPMYHDMGLIGFVFGALHAGARCHLMSPFAFARRPLSWLAAISELQATTSAAPNFAFELCVARATPEAVAKLNLRSWKTIVMGAEPVVETTVRRFFDTFADAGLSSTAAVPAYGLAEATVLVSATPAGPGRRTLNLDGTALDAGLAVTTRSTGAVTIVSSGRPAADTEVVVVDRTNRELLPDGQIGEILIRGPGVADGYWNDAEKTAETFGHVVDGVGGFLATGDLGFMRDGELFVTGRTKEILITNGRNVHPQDVELVVQHEHRSFRLGCGAAFSDHGRVVLVQEVKGRDPEELEALMRVARLTVARDLDVALDAVVLVPRGQVSKTSSGKIQRMACRAAYQEGRLHVLCEWRREGALVP